MKIIKSLHLEKYDDREKYRPMDDTIFEDLGGETYCLTLYCELEEGEDTQYPLEDILDEYYVNCTGYLEEQEVEGKRILIVEMEGSLDRESNLEHIKAVSGLIGKRVFNCQNGKSVTLGIE